MKYFYKTLSFLLDMLERVFKFTIKYPLVFIFFVLVLIISVFVLTLNKKASVGGVLGKILSYLGVGKPEEDLSNTVVVGRKQKIGEADKEGFKQIKVEELESSLNPFRDKTKVKLPNDKVVKLPTGIKDTDISEIYYTEVEVVIVPREEAHSKVNAAFNKRQLQRKIQVTKTDDMISRLKEKL